MFTYKNPVNPPFSITFFKVTSLKRLLEVPGSQNDKHKD